MSLIEIRSNYSNKVIGYADQVVVYDSDYGELPVYMSLYTYQSTMRTFRPSINKIKNSANNMYRMTSDDYIYFSFKVEDEFGPDFFGRFRWGHLPYINVKQSKIQGTDMVNAISYAEETDVLTTNRPSHHRHLIYLPLSSILNNIAGNDRTKILKLRNRDALLKGEVMLSKAFQSEIYKLLRNTTSIPVLEDWVEYLINNDCIYCKLCRCLYSDLYNEDNIFVVEVCFNEASIKGEIARGLAEKRININGSNEVSERTQKIQNLTDYLGQYSGQLIDKAANKFTPIFNPEQDSFSEKEQDYFDFAEYYGRLKFFEAQKNVIASIARNLVKNKSCLVVGEMGTGKTAMATGAVFLNNKKKNAGTVIMAPGHLVEKWKREINRLYPQAEAYILTSFDSLLSIEDRITDKHRNNPIFLIISKDTAKITYAEEPAVLYNSTTGLFTCPNCGKRVVIGGESRWNSSIAGRIKINKHRVAPYLRILEYTAFLNRNAYNTSCRYDDYEYTFGKRTKSDKIVLKKGSELHSCQASLWSAINNQKESNWIKLPSGFIHKDMIPGIKQYKDQLGNASPKTIRTINKLYREVIDYEESLDKRQYAPRRYSIAKYIREKFKNYIDYFIADEVHMYSSNSSAQAEAFGDFVKAATKTLALTGTLLNGYADGIYHILYRMYPRTFTKLGYKYGSTKQFVEDYGVHQTIEIRNNSTNATIRKSTKTLPGVSPKLFTEFLLDKAVFISLEDMSSGLPKYTETPVAVELESFVEPNYTKAIQDFKNASNSDVGISFAFTATQKLILYPDQPYNMAPVYDKEQNPVVIFNDSLSEDEVKEYVSNKDLKTLELAQKHINRGENVLIYVNYVNKTDCIDRLSKLFKAADIKYCILDAKIPAKDREEWIDTKVKDGYRVMICNPSLVETGLDLLAFTTIIFYQVGYNLFTMRQASRRSLRLNQPNNVNVYFLYYENTIQESILSLMANKLQAAMAIEGKFSEEGLNAMSNNDSILTQIADSLVKDIQYRVESGAFSTGLGTPEDDDGSRFELVNMLNDDKKKQLIHGLFEVSKRSRKSNYDNCLQVLGVAV